VAPACVRAAVGVDPASLSMNVNAGNAGRMSFNFFSS
jgi:hypothetical protein